MKSLLFKNMLLIFFFIISFAQGQEEESSRIKVNALRLIKEPIDPIGPVGSLVIISGSKNVNLGETYTYTASASGVSIFSGTWTVNGATIINENATSVTIKWTTLGVMFIEYSATNTTSGLLQGFYGVTVKGGYAPPSPLNPSISSQDCSKAILWRSAPPLPSEIKWYWQGTNSNGTSISNLNNSYTATSSGRYYLRAKDNATGLWSVVSSYVDVTIGVIGGVKWYADIDRDGLGDPNQTKIQCVKPINYVSNNNDQCPESHGGGALTGCPYGTGSSNENYVYTITPQKGVLDVVNLIKTEDAINSVTYFDGLGRVKQEIGIKQSSSERDIVIHHEYDELGREKKSFLPYSDGSGDGFIKNDAFFKTNAYYKTNYTTDINSITPNPFSEKEFDESPLNRVLKQSAPGYDWRLGGENEVELNYGTNISSEVRIYKVSLNSYFEPTLIGGVSFYSKGELYKIITKDENHTGINKINSIEEFKNKLGKVVLKRAYITNTKTVDTYYVYDDYGNLTYVLPPKSEAHTSKPDSNVLEELCYQYEYDIKNRLATKKLPGKGKQIIVYDQLDRPVLVQDANLRLQNKWLFTKYDALGREVYTGIYTGVHIRNVTKQSSIQSYFDTQNNKGEKNYEEKLITEGSLGIYYTNDNFPNSNLEVLTVNYYDNYDFNRSGTVASINNSYGVNSTIRLNGLPTGKKVRVLETNDWVTTVIFYDEKARPIYSYVKNDFLKTTDIVKNKLNFTGRVEETTSLHTKEDDTLPMTLKVVDRFDYDHIGRLLSQKQCIGDSTLIDCGNSSNSTNIEFTEIMTISGHQTITDNNSIILKPGFEVKSSTGNSISFVIAEEGVEVVLENRYDELGKLIEKKVGGKASQSRLQTVNYTYNIRGWLKKINDDNITTDNDLFNFSLKYSNPTDASKALYNGNISQTSWNTLNGDTSSKTYTYSYDALNRITSATGVKGVNYDISGIEYDKNGNIKNLIRNGYQNGTNFINMDKLVYSYDSGNKLHSVTDNGNDTYGFKDGNASDDIYNNGDDDYTYDVNGNMIKDANKGITNITYNHLNLPTKITINGRDIKYVYDAIGTKLTKINKVYSSAIITEYAGNYIYKKITGRGGSTKLEFFNHPEGYVSPVNASDISQGFKYVYQYKDHLGNVRLSYTDNNNDGVITASNEIIEESNYYPFGLKHKGYNNNVLPLGNSTAQKFGFGSKELNDDLVGENNLNWHDFGARNYDAALGRWMNLDPLTEQMRNNSPYVYAFNSPVFFRDPDGMAPLGPDDPKIHKIKTGETLTAISRRYGVSIRDLMSMNDISNANHIKAGKTLSVNPEVDFSNNPHGGYQNKSNSEGEQVVKNHLLMVVADFVVGASKENSLIVGGEALKSIQNWKPVKDRVNKALIDIKADGKIEPGETVTDSYSPGNIINWAKNNWNKTWISPVHVIGSFGFTARVNANGKSVTVTVYDSKTLKSGTDNYGGKELNRNRSENDKLDNILTNTYQRYIWELDIKQQ